MGKSDNPPLPIVRQQQSQGSWASRAFFCQRCSVGVYRQFNLRCVVVLIFGLAAFFSVLFWVLPIRHRQPGFDAKDSIKLSASVQAYFKLQRPVSNLVPFITRLEYDINEEIGVPSMKVVVLSMHAASLSNWTNVVFGFIPDPIDNTINSVPLSVLKSSLIDLFFQEYNLTLTSQIFGEPSSFEILKFSGGITIIPERASFSLRVPQPIFNFTLNSSIEDIRENIVVLKQQLKLGLRLMFNEVVYVQVTNKKGSTTDPPVTVQAFIASDRGILLPERLRQLAQIIVSAPRTENLGLDHSVFGKVKEISLSSFLNYSLRAPLPSPTPSPSPSPEVDGNRPSLPPDYSPASSPDVRESPPPCSDCYASAPSWASRGFLPSPNKGPDYSFPPSSNSPAPSVAKGSPYYGSTGTPRPSPTRPDQLSPNLSPRPSFESPLVGLAPHIPPSMSSHPNQRSGRSVVSSPLSASSASSQSSKLLLLNLYYASQYCKVDDVYVAHLRLSHKIICCGPIQGEEHSFNNWRLVITPGLSATEI